MMDNMEKWLATITKITLYVDDYKNGQIFGEASIPDWKGETTFSHPTGDVTTLRTAPVAWGVFTAPKKTTGWKK